MKMLRLIMFSIVLISILSTARIYFSQIQPHNPKATEIDIADEERHLYALRLRSLRSKFPKQTLEAIRGLEQLAKKKALSSPEAPILISRYLDFRLDESDPEDYDRPAISPRTSLNNYPAIEALFNIGTEALPAVLHVIENERDDSLAFQNAIWTVIYIENGSFKRAYNYLQEQAIVASDRRARQKLLFAAKRIADYDPQILTK